MPVVLFWSVWSVVALIASGLLTSKLIRWAPAWGAIDVPNARSSHTRVTPRGGGIAIVAVTLAAATLVAILHPEAITPLAGVLVPAVVVAAVSWIDDIRTLSNRARFAVHVAGAIASVAVLGPIRHVSLGSFGGLDFGAAAWPLTLLWIVGLTNVFNFMDGIDGIAGTTATVAAVAIATVAVAFGSPGVGGVAAALAAASSGFLICNWHPAKIFMGDVGSAFCGFVLAALPLALPQPAPALAVSVVAATLWPFIFDSAYTIVRRLRLGENIFQAHRSHLYQRLVTAGWSHRAVSSLYGMLSLITGALTVLPLFAPALRQPADLVAVAFLMLGIVLLPSLVFVSTKKP